MTRPRSCEVSSSSGGNLESKAVVVGARQSAALRLVTPQATVSPRNVPETAISIRHQIDEKNRIVRNF
jgi:hypothetical protein